VIDDGELRPVDGRIEADGGDATARRGAADRRSPEEPLEGKIIDVSLSTGELGETFETVHGERIYRRRLSPHRYVVTAPGYLPWWLKGTSRGATDDDDETDIAFSRRRPQAGAPLHHPVDQPRHRRCGRNVRRNQQTRAGRGSRSIGPGIPRLATPALERAGAAVARRGRRA